MTDRKDNYINTPIEEGIKRYMEECKSNPKHGLVTICFPELSQKFVEELHEEIEHVLEDHFGVIVMVDV